MLRFEVHGRHKMVYEEMVSSSSTDLLLFRASNVAGKQAGHHVHIFMILKWYVSRVFPAVFTEYWPETLYFLE